MAKSKRSSKPRRRAARKGAKRNPNNIGGPNTCKVVESLPTISIPLNTPILVNKAGITGVRAPVIAQTFGLYRIAQIKFTYKPKYDTYLQALPSTGSNAVQVPYLYWKMNRYGDTPAAFNGDYMRALGAKPNRLDDKNITVVYRPNILTAQQNTAATTTSGVKMTPWLSTDDTPQDNNFTLSTALHYGHSFFVEAAGAGAANAPVCDLDIQVIYEFKNPRVIRSANAQGNQAMPLLL